MPPARGLPGAHYPKWGCWQAVVQPWNIWENSCDDSCGDDILNSSVWWRSQETLAARADHRLCWARYYQEEMDWEVFRFASWEGRS